MGYLIKGRKLLLKGMEICIPICLPWFLACSGVFVLWNIVKADDEGPKRVSNRPTKHTLIFPDIEHPEDYMKETVDVESGVLDKTPDNVKLFWTRKQIFVNNLIVERAKAFLIDTDNNNVRSTRFNNDYPKVQLKPLLSNIYHNRINHQIPMNKFPLHGMNRDIQQRLLWMDPDRFQYNSTPGKLSLWQQQGREKRNALFANAPYRALHTKMRDRRNRITLRSDYLIPKLHNRWNSRIVHIQRQHPWSADHGNRQVRLGTFHNNKLLNRFITIAPQTTRIFNRRISRVGLMQFLLDSLMSRVNPGNRFIPDNRLNNRLISSEAPTHKSPTVDTPDKPNIHDFVGNGFTLTAAAMKLITGKDPVRFFPANEI